ncbi:MAG: hypothetical protein VW405_00875 [Rhodospirillaceae bacterium]
MMDCLNVFAFETVTVAGSSTALTAATYSPTGAPGAERALLTLEAGQIRWRADGTAPTATVGHLVEIGDSLTLLGAETITKFRGIRTGGTSGTLSVSYQR